MKVLYSPQRSDERIEYEFSDMTIVAHYNGQTDEFDFSGLGDGKLEGVESDLPINPIVSAEIKNGELFVKLLYYHGKDATQEELFPEEKDHTELEVGVYNG